MSTITYLDRFLDPVAEVLTPELAEKIVSLRVDEETESRIAQLREKAGEGTLTADEDLEYKEFVEAVDILSIFQSKARKFLKKQSV